MTIHSKPVDGFSSNQKRIAYPTPKIASISLLGIFDSDTVFGASTAKANALRSNFDRSEGYGGASLFDPKGHHIKMPVSNATANINNPPF